MALAGANRRGALRRRVRRHLLFRHVDQPVFSVDTTSDLSAGGLFIATTRPLVIGSKIIGYLRTDQSGNQAPIAFEARVAWRSPRLDESPKGPGLGVTFTRMDRASRRRLALLLERVPPTIS